MDKPFCELSVEVSRLFFGDEHMFAHYAGDISLETFAGIYS